MFCDFLFSLISEFRRFCEYAQNVRICAKCAFRGGSKNPDFGGFAKWSLLRLSLVGDETNSPICLIISVPKTPPQGGVGLRKVLPRGPPDCPPGMSNSEKRYLKRTINEIITFITIFVFIVLRFLFLLFLLIVYYRCIFVFRIMFLAV